MLEEYEDKLRLFEKFQQRQVVIDQLQQLIQAETVNKELAFDLIVMLKESD